MTITKAKWVALGSSFCLLLTSYFLYAIVTHMEIYNEPFLIPSEIWADSLSIWIPYVVVVGSKSNYTYWESYTRLVTFN